MKRTDVIQAKCLNCRTIIVSPRDGHMRSCKCFRENQQIVNEFSKTHPEEDKEFWDFVKLHNRGFAIDATPDYVRILGNNSDIGWMGEGNE